LIRTIACLLPTRETDAYNRDLFLLILLAVCLGTAALA